MFTGIVEETGIIRQIQKSTKAVHLVIGAQRILEGSKVGDSICTSGICLTITGLGQNSFEADVMPETLRCSKLSALGIGSRVNLERALRLDTRLGGHLVSGHIDGTGILTHIEKEANALWLSIEVPKEILRYIITKGSITLDGVSLTVASTDPTGFKVSIIPHTGAQTTLLQEKCGSRINLECDPIGKYVEKLLGISAPTTVSEGGLSADFLRTNGFC